MVVSPGSPWSTVLWPAPHTRCLHMGTVWALCMFTGSSFLGMKYETLKQMVYSYLPTCHLSPSFSSLGLFERHSEAKTTNLFLTWSWCQLKHYSSLLLQVTLPLVQHDLNIATSSVIWFTAVVFHTDFSSVAWKVIHNDRSCTLLAGIQRANEGHGGGSLCYLTQKPLPLMLNELWLVRKTSQQGL